MATFAEGVAGAGGKLVVSDRGRAGWLEEAGVSVAGPGVCSEMDHGVRQ